MHAQGRVIFAVDDNEDDNYFFKRVCRRAGLGCAVETVTSGEDAAFRLANFREAGVAAPVLTMGADSEALPVQMMRWGFVPFWETALKPKLAPINAQAEKAATTGMFRQLVQKRRCVVPADGFYEWLRFDERTKYAFDIHLKDGRPFVIARIYEGATETRPATFAVLTTCPNELMARIHDRMPAILDDEEASAGCGPARSPPKKWRSSRCRIQLRTWRRCRSPH